MVNAFYISVPRHILNKYDTFEKIAASGNFQKRFVVKFSVYH